MKYAVSNIALTPHEHADELIQLREVGLDGIEVAPSRAWKDTWHGLSAPEIDVYRRQIEAAGLETVGLHSLLFDRPDLALCETAGQRRGLMEFFVHLSAVCRDLGGRTLIWGGGRRRGKIPEDEAGDVAVTFFGELTDRIADHGTVFCIEPLAPGDTDFLNSVIDCQKIVHRVGSPSLKIQIDVKALATNGELSADVFARVAPDLVHVHANEPGFGTLGSSGEVDHAAAGEFLRKLRYDDFVSIEQKQLDADDPIGPIGQSASVLREAY